METKANYVAVGAFVMICLLGLVVTLLWLAGAQYSQEYAYFETYFKGPVTGLGSGTTVRYNGIDVGRVTDLRFDPNDPQKVVVTLQVKPDLNIREDSEASIESEGLTGGSYVEISGGTATSPLLTLKEGQKYPVIKSRPSTLQQLVQSAPQLVAKLNKVADRVNDLFNDSNRARFASILSNVDGTMADLHQTSSVLAKHSGDIDTILANFSKASAEIGPTLANANESVGKFGKLATDADNFVNSDGLAQVGDVLREARSVLANLSRVTSTLGNQPTTILFGDRRKGYTPK